MTESSRDLLKSFGKLLQNRAFLMAVSHQPGMGEHGGPGGGRGKCDYYSYYRNRPRG